MKVSQLISDGMVIQRDRPFIVNGLNEPNEKIVLAFREKSYQTMSTANGEWQITIDATKAGGPFQLTIIGDQKLELNNVLVGDVWLLGGQSNMELPVRRTLDLFADELKTVNQPLIRHFAVPQIYNFEQPQAFIEGGEWCPATQEHLYDFSAAGVFFASEMYQKEQVPIGLIQAAVGGTPIEAWLSEETLRQYGGFDPLLANNKNSERIEQTIELEQQQQALWYTALNLQDRGLIEQWYQHGEPALAWQKFEVPGSWAETELATIRGAVWFTREFVLPESIDQGPAQLKLGTIVDADDTYINGHYIGGTAYKYPPRRYPIPEGILKPGRNTIMVRVISTNETGQFIPGMPYEIKTDQASYSLAGTWHYQVGAVTDPLSPMTFFQYHPSGVFNGMIAPLNGLSVKGVLWYQGESNTGDPDDYAEKFKRLVKDWRITLAAPTLPFIFVQLANLETGNQQQESNWALLRDQQRQCLEIDHTAMVVSIDIGEANDLHPQDKKTLGQRLARCAQGLTTSKQRPVMGPIFQSKQLSVDGITVYFNHVGQGLVCKGKALGGFELSIDQINYQPACAKIVNNHVFVYHDQIKQPKYVRYAWADNPTEANLYNQEGLPASPFQA
ncbi:sialate O-acetylesterase [Amphibacillus marinus]|uniref:Sialate O-acetylesterase n=1 Tax=Amphibacillus marinus TaxID=872970 RepID=A0A1H8LMW3_9BACI|nr:sialate O-acetylesterase [Amphibacillus marinus]SEO06429.1 sialate O-acetylesterase [Amphibacillus marinus]